MALPQGTGLPESPTLNMNGKGSKRRPSKPGVYARGYDAIDWRGPEYRLIVCDDNWFVIRADEESVFWHWCLAKEGKRRFPRDFAPVKVDGPHQVVFKEWKQQK